MKNIKGLTTVNGGKIIEINNKEVEILSHHFHNPYCNIVCDYFLDENGNKVEVTFYKDITTGKTGSEVYKFKDKEELQHYYSRNYNIDSIPKKYIDKVNELKSIYNQIDFEAYKTRR